MPTRVRGYRTKSGKRVKGYTRNGGASRKSALRHVGARRRLAGKIGGMQPNQTLRYRGSHGLPLFVSSGQKGPMPFGYLAPSSTKFMVNSGEKRVTARSAKEAARHVYKMKGTTVRHSPKAAARPSRKGRRKARASQVTHEFMLTR